MMTASVLIWWGCSRNDQETINEMSQTTGTTEVNKNRKVNKMGDKRFPDFPDGLLPAYTSIAKCMSVLAKNCTFQDSVRSIASRDSNSNASINTLCSNPDLIACATKAFDGISAITATDKSIFFSSISSGVIVDGVTYHPAIFFPCVNHEWRVSCSPNGIVNRVSMTGGLSQNNELTAFEYNSTTKIISSSQIKKHDVQQESIWYVDFVYAVGSDPDVPVNGPKARCVCVAVTPPPGSKDVLDCILGGVGSSKCGTWLTGCHPCKQPGHE